MLSAMINSESPYRSDHLLEVFSKELLIGMFVVDLDCAWSETPFTLGGFHIKNHGEIQILLKYCKKVHIDINKGVKPRREKLNQLTILSSARQAVPTSAALKVKREEYPVSRSLKQQIDKSFRLYTSLKQDFQAAAQSIRAGDKVDFDEFNRSIEGLTGAIIANPQTLIWILNTDPSEYTPTGYCVRASIWATILARQIGMSRDDMHILFLGTLLADIGMSLLPEHLVNKQRPFSKKDLQFYRKHVELGLEILADYPSLDDRVSSILRCHHERHDGLGFPRKLRGEQIPELARFSNMAYCFERLLKSNSGDQLVPPSKALAKLYKQRVLKFPQQLVVEFIHVLGSFPIGSMVELSSSEIALVLEQNSSARLYPKVAIIAESDGVPLEKPRIVELANQPSSEEPLSISTVFKTDCSHKKATIKPSIYTFSFCGIRVGFGAIGLRF